MGFNVGNPKERKVKCISNYEGIMFGCDNELLEVGKIYTVSGVNVRKWHTEVRLQELKGRFNSVSFDEIE